MKHIPVPISTQHQFQRLYFSHSGHIIMLTIMLCASFGNAQPITDIRSINQDADHDHQHQCISPEQSLMIKHKARVAAERAYKTPAFKALVARERAKTAALNHVYFAWPLKAVPEYAHIPFDYTIEFYVDHGTGTSLLDYQCNERTYNGHHGTDINIWPFFWHMMEEEYVHIVAAAPGIVLPVDDGNNNDQNCSGCNGTGNNHVSILHADSTISYYLHIKNNSALVEEDDIVEEGTPIAFVGSSGCSYNPHLHFEVDDSDGSLIDPFAGSCNGLNGNDTWWQNEKPYWEPRINRLMTHSAEPELHGYDGSNAWCPSGESINKKNQFSPGETVWLGAAVYSPQPDDEIDFRIYNSAGTQLLNVSYTFPGNEPSVKQYLAFSYMLAANAPTGTYRFRALYNNVVYNHWFTVSCTSSYTLSGALPFHHGYISSSFINNTGQTSAAGSTAYYQSAGHVSFLPGFHATPGVSLNARIRSCGYSE